MCATQRFVVEEFAPSHSSLAVRSSSAGRVAATVEAGMFGAGSASLLELSPQRLARSMKPYGGVVRRDAEGCGDLCEGTLLEVRPSQDVRVFALHRGKQRIHAPTDSRS